MHKIMDVPLFTGRPLIYVPLFNGQPASDVLAVRHSDHLQSAGWAVLLPGRPCASVREATNGALHAKRVKPGCLLQWRLMISTLKDCLKGSPDRCRSSNMSSYLRILPFSTFNKFWKNRWPFKASGRSKHQLPF